MVTGGVQADVTVAARNRLALRVLYPVPRRPEDGGDEGLGSARRDLNAELSYLAARDALEAVTDDVVVPVPAERRGVDLAPCCLDERGQAAGLDEEARGRGRESL